MFSRCSFKSGNAWVLDADTRGLCDSLVVTLRGCMAKGRVSLEKRLIAKSYLLFSIPRGSEGKEKRETSGGGT